MHTPTPGRGDDLSEVERRLSGWRPSAAGLDADAALFAAGRAAGRRGRRLWPALSLILAVQSVGLGLWAVSERAGRRALADRLAEPAPLPSPAPAAADDGPPEPSPDGYLHLRRRVEQDPNGWPASLPPPGPGALPKPPPEPTILRADQSDSLLDQ
jgi:hypothetical protein